jgi:outer membrane protein
VSGYRYLYQNSSLMKVALIVWNVLLTAGLGYLIFSGTISRSEGISIPSVADTSGLTAVSGVPIAFVNIDTLEARYDLFSRKRKEMEQKQQSSEGLFNRKMEEFQNDYVAAQQAAATMTQSQMEETQQKLQQKQMELQQLQEKLQTDFQKQLEGINKELEDSLNSFVEDYNANRQYAYILSYTAGGTILYGEPALDITNEVVEGMNGRLKKDK